MDFKLWGGPTVDQGGESILESKLRRSQGLEELPWKVAYGSQPRIWRRPVRNKADRKHEIQTKAKAKLS